MMILELTGNLKEKNELRIKRIRKIQITNERNSKEMQKSIWRNRHNKRVKDKETHRSQTRNRSSCKCNSTETEACTVLPRETSERIHRTRWSGWESTQGWSSYLVLTNSCTNKTKRCNERMWQNRMPYDLC